MLCRQYVLCAQVIVTVLLVTSLVNALKHNISPNEWYELSDTLTLYMYWLYMPLVIKVSVFNLQLGNAMVSYPDSRNGGRACKAYCFIMTPGGVNFQSSV